MEKVILLHGIFLHQYHMYALANYLRRSGQYEVVNIAYPSRRYSIPDLAQIVKQKISSEFQSEQKINLVGFSMGGLILRYLLTEIYPQNPGRLVMIATPNHGSEIADYVSGSRLIRFLYGPALQDLQTTATSNIPALSKTQIEYGIIAGNNASSPFFNRFFSGQHDGTVAVNRTILDDQKDHIVLPFSHTFGPFNSAVMRQTDHFLKTGNFIR